MTSLKRRNEKLEAAQPKNKSLSHLTDRELEALMIESRKIIDGLDCSNCADCTTPRECKELHFKLEESEKRLAVIKNTV